MENSYCAEILNAMPETGVYVIREEDHGLLYFNNRAKEVSRNARLGAACHEVWTGSCSCCPLLAMEDGRTTGRSISYNEAYGGIVDIAAARLLWGGETPAFVITVDPRVDTSGYTYRKILHVDLEKDRCDVLKSDPDMLLSLEGGPLSQLLEQFARSGAVHSEDAERFIAFTRIEHLRAAARAGEETLTLIYRRQMGTGEYRWNLIEFIPWMAGGGHSALLCVKDVHSVLREGLEREGLTVRGQELTRTLGERNSNIYTIDLNSGAANPIRVDGQMQEKLQSLPWSRLMRTHILDRLHEAYQYEFEHRFSLEGLRHARESGQQKTELLCQWRSGEDYRYISVTAYFGNENAGISYTVLALQDVDERMRQELHHTKRDMQMAAILKSRYQMMNTVFLDNGQCERISLAASSGPENVLIGDYAAYLQRAIDFHVHPDDVERYQQTLSLEHLRRKAESVGEYEDEVCQYRTREDDPRWIELHVLYSRQKDHVMVNILGQDITREKSQEEQRLRALEDRAYMITSLSSLFFSTYYIDLERDTFRAVTQQRRVSDVLGDEVNFTTAIQLYANHFIHPDDREKYLETMNVRNLWRSLRWWQPYAAVEFRKLPDPLDPEKGACQWVRATAVLARTSSDDMPKTVVYVARDITESDREDNRSN